MDYDWGGFILLFAALLIFVAIILLIAGGVVLVRRGLAGRKTRNQRKARELAEIAKHLREDSR